MCPILSQAGSDLDSNSSLNQSNNEFTLNIKVDRRKMIFRTGKHFLPFRRLSKKENSSSIEYVEERRI
ncbi:CLUMA_CG011341, isoform A [Clunio marinus]|uniref:CLUMA_CG011333, isoform A n=1 Tax=Clunio marinus TaxID=568069 RepID=A0A1J1IHP0_9DIPT|nr:CLUMA_CG011333, isoform A [Clunio marinus]CRK97969.1 CLUMA_CG011341, isoform A [Clunio marinus]